MNTNSHIPQPLAKLSHPREAIRQFTPNWFTATMGTGVLALALNQFPYGHSTLYPIADFFWRFNIFLFVLFSVLYLLRWMFFPNEAKAIFQHPVVSMFFGAIPMGLATILNGFLAFGINRWGQTAVSIAYGLWWIDALLALLCAVVLPYLMFTRQTHSIENMTAVWLLPIVAAEVTAASGGLLAPHLTDASSAVLIFFMSYILWAISVPLAMGVLVILFMRLVLHKLPPRDMAVSSWLSLGPIGTGALGLLLLGGDAPTILAPQGMASMGVVAQGFGVIAGTILWGYGLWWLVMAVLITLRYIKEGLPFNMGWWGFTFPIGVYSLATLALARSTHLQFFEWAGAFLVVMLTGFWVLVSIRTVIGAYQGTLFFSPCLSVETGLADPVCGAPNGE
ncbi:C4-dicarboxylate ABC transporter [Sulfuriferula plumbiphila]|uniref:C4-dicarboxylate ABC transporter n=1 Tax=Sulfuriferula plumbiphila TaxID=171865 RepID=A0A512L8T5_9PROT|nr:TDT family transporter [Sulfuriferula plumbiphila]BBP04265.1 C4-dicarboxylate ABC transporter [Sulfuriferula plumbiphila]GEP30905.1 C4-dicarboxylate ABC transporter [Sulfuriferula plumbiphila]